MRVEVDFGGLDRLRRKIAALDGTHRIPVDELLSPSFMGRCSQFSSFQEMVDASPFAGQDFEAIPDAAWDEYVCRNTRFASWQAMLQEAALGWTGERLFGR